MVPYLATIFLLPTSTMCTNSGKHVFLDLFKTNCSSCESFHNSNAFENYYNLYAKAGTINDAVVFQYETQVQTTLDDLKGLTAGNTFNFLNGVSYPTVNESNNNKMWNLYSAFLPAGTSSLSFGTPTLFLICADKKFYEFSSSVDATQMRALVSQKCGLAALGTNDIHTLGFSFNISPNPASDELKLDIRNANTQHVNITIANTVGQIVHTSASNNNGDYTSRINTSAWQNGIYFITLQNGLDKVTSRVMISH
jgi:Secretion system C-terminal sorting domain